MEEARLDLMEQIGVSYDRLEELGIIIPVLEIHCYYKHTLKFNDEILVLPKLTKLTPVRFTVQYEIQDAKTGEMKHIAESSHCFVNREFKPLNLKKAFPEVYSVFESVLEK
jgi:acyl-CoA thioester hydrolase